MKIIIAIGGNALGNSPTEQIEIVKKTASKIVDVVEQKHTVVLVHGNGPQVGMINLGFSIANKTDSQSPLLDFPECGSMSQGYIGYHLQQAIENELKRRKINNSTASIVTQTVVDSKDSAFKNPTKPVGLFYSKETADKLSKENNWVMKEDAGRGFRRVVPSPKPIDIVEKDIIKTLVEKKYITVVAGGGGIPVIKTEDGYKGVAAVIDKDFAAAKVAEIVEADSLIILTAIDNVMINYNKPDNKSLEEISISECEKYISEEQFASGSMLPKIQAAMQFVKSTGKDAFIGSLDKADLVIDKKSGTRIYK